MKRALFVALALALAACPGGGGSGAPDAADTDASDPDAATPGDTFTSFVIDQIVNQTADDTDAVPYATFATLDDPDLDNPAAYDSLFP